MPLFERLSARLEKNKMEKNKHSASRNRNAVPKLNSFRGYPVPGISYSVPAWNRISVPNPNIWASFKPGLTTVYIIKKRVKYVIKYKKN